MLTLAVTAIEAMKTVPTQTWLIMGGIVAGIIAAAIILPKIFKMNKIVLGVIIVVISSVVFFSWVKQRNEPAFLTPLIDRLAPFFDSDVQYKKNEKKMPK
jgi:hypothetical protein